MLAAEALVRHKTAYELGSDSLVLRDAGKYHWRAGGEKHLNEPASIASLQESAVNKNRSAYNRFVESTMQSVRDCMLRGRLELRTLDEPLPLSEIEPASEIVKRFATGAMSFGSISLESHQTLAIAMNKVLVQVYGSVILYQRCQSYLFLKLLRRNLSRSNSAKRKYTRCPHKGTERLYLYRGKKWLKTALQ